jgi:hypothetical protein
MCMQSHAERWRERTLAYSQGPRLRLEFWRAFKEYMTGRDFATCGRASSETWMHHDGKLNCGRLFSMIRVRQGEIGSQYALDDHTASTVYAFLSTHRGEIDALFGQSLTWRTVSERMYEVEIRRPADISRRDDWMDLFVWLSKNLRAFQRSLGPFLGRSTSAAHQGNWDEQSFFDMLAKHSPHATDPARHLLEWGHATMPHLRWGHGRRAGSFVPTVLREGTEHSVISVWTDGLFVVRFGALRKDLPFSDERLRRELLARLNRVRCFRLPPTVIDLYPGLPLPLLADTDTMDGFISALDWCAGQLKSR